MAGQVTVRIGVLGGGISGLTFASLIKDAEVIEKEKTFGGMMRSLSEGGFTFDLGSHILFSKNRQTLDFLLSLLGDNLLTHRRNTKIFYKGQQVKYPFENGLGDLPKEEALECAHDYEETYHKRESGTLPKPQNFKEWMYYHFGKGITEKYLYPYNRKMWDYPPEKMDLFWVEGRVPQPLLEDVNNAAKSIASEGYLHQLNFHYPKKGGIQAVTDSLAGRIGKERLRSDFEVKKIKKEEGKWVVKGSGSEEHTYGHLVSTIHIADFIDAYDGAPKEVRNAAHKLRWNSIYLVMLGIGKPKTTDLHWAYLPDAELLPNRIGFPSNLSPANAPQGRSSVLAEITFDPKGKKAKMKEKEVLGRTIEDLHGLGIFDKKDVVFTKLVKMKYAYVVYDLEYQKNIKIIEDFTKNEGFTLLGRFSEFQYYNSDKCVERAMEKAVGF